MRQVRQLLALSILALLVAVPVSAAPGASGALASAAQAHEYLVLYAEGASRASARAAVQAAGGSIARESAIGLAAVMSSNPAFLTDVRASSAIAGAARNHSIGTVKPGMAHKFADERLSPEERATYAPGNTDPPPGDGSGALKEGKKKSGTEPLSALQWDMKMIGATPDGAWSTTKGKGVTVGIIDTGVDASHPDIAPNFDASLSRNFVTDIPAVDGPCEYAGCKDPVGVDDGAHGTHVAGTVAAAMNGLGISGVAPEATIVEIRAGQDSGYFFLQETVDALEYAGDAGIDVVNMSFYTDPWLYNCASTSDYVSGSTEGILEQQVIRAALIAALDYAHARGVTLIAAAGNGASDYDTPTRPDASSPDYPGGTEIERVVTDNCLDLPTEGPNVISVSALGPSGNKSDYSDYGIGHIDVAAPGGYFRDGLGTATFRTPENMVLSSYPEHVALEEGSLNPGGGVPKDAFVIRDCSVGVCGYYEYLQGTSMASPHATGVAALIIAAHGASDGHGGFSMDPGAVRAYLTGTANEHACPVPATVDYTLVGRPASWNATCVGSLSYNSFYGFGIVSAANAVK
jgi:subtilisin family serine protease